MIDTHAHLNFKAFKDDWQDVVERAVKLGVEKVIVVGTDILTSKKAVAMADEHEALYASVGVHPHHARGLTDSRFKIQDLRKQLEKLAGHQKVVAIGEVGLDYHTYRNSKYQMANDKLMWAKIKNLQKRLLGMQIELTKKLRKPMIIHSREAKEDVLDVIEHFSKSDGKLPKGVFHCFEGSKKHLQKILEAGFYVSFTGNVTYVKDRAGVAKEVPLDRILLETDCPFMKPNLAGMRPKSERSEPNDVKILAEFHAKERGISLDEVAKQTTKNAIDLFRI